MGSFSKSIFEPSVWINAVELDCPDQGLDGGARTPARSDLLLGHSLSVLPVILALAYFDQPSHEQVVPNERMFCLNGDGIGAGDYPGFFSGATSNCQVWRGERMGMRSIFFRPRRSWSPVRMTSAFADSAQARIRISSGSAMGMVGDALAAGACSSACNRTFNTCHRADGT